MKVLVVNGSWCIIIVLEIDKMKFCGMLCFVVVFGIVIENKIKDEELFCVF